MITQTRQFYSRTSQDIDFQFFGSPTVLHATGDATDGRFCLFEHVTMPPGLASPYHRHHNEDEAFYIVEGNLRFVCDGEWLDAGPGTWVYGPREIPHGFKVVGDRPARMLLMCTPAGFEKFVLELCSPVDAEPGPPDMAKLADAAARFNLDLLGPLPDDPMGDVIASASTAPFKEAVARVRTQHVAAVNAGDVEAATALFAPNAVFLPPGQPPLEGGTAIRTWFTHVFASFQIEGFRLDPGGVDEHGDTAIEHGAWNATFRPKDSSPAFQVGGTYLTAYTRLSDGSVRMLRDTFNGLPG